jgi:hypothetical protein
MTREIPMSAPTNERTRRCLALVVVVVLSVAACSADGSSDAGSPAADRASTTDRVATTGPDRDEPETATDQDLADELQPDAAELGAGEQVEPFPSGGQVEGQVSLDYCGFTFRTEELRTGRRQVSIVDGAGQSAGSVEVIVYRPGAAAAAMTEMRRAIEQCPDELVPSVVKGVPPLRYVATPLPDPEVISLASDRIAISVTATPEAGEALHRTLVFQRRGRIIIAAYADDDPTALAHARSAAKRLAALPEKVVGPD